MFDIKDINYVPEIDEISRFIRNPLFDELYTTVESAYKAKCKIEFSKCSWEYGWNVKLKKSGKSLCTIYPSEM